MSKKGPAVQLQGPIGDLARHLGGVIYLAQKMGVEPKTIRNWAQGKRKPRGPAAIMLRELIVKELKLQLGEV